MDNRPIRSSPSFTTDWFTPHVPHLGVLLGDLRGKPGVTMLEIGSFEGRSTLWFLENVVTGPGATITCVDTFLGSEENIGVVHDELKSRFLANIAPWSDRVRTLEGDSGRVLRTIPPDPAFDVIYIDGSHQTPDVLQDAILAWPVLRDGGMLIFDDYVWAERPSRPGPAIDAFLKVFEGRYELLHKSYQVAVRKTDPRRIAQSE